MALDAEGAGTWLRRWWVEAVLSLLVLWGAASGLRRGDAVRTALAVALGATLADRTRLRLDNRSLAVAIGEIRGGGVSAARRSAVADEADEAEAGPAVTAGRDTGRATGDTGRDTGRATGDTGRDTGGVTGTVDDDDRRPLDREVVADLLGEDPENVSADDVAALVRRAERRAGTDEADGADVADLIREAERSVDEKEETDVADLIREAESNPDGSASDDEGRDER